MAGWTEERIEILKRLWADGLSASQIADELGSVTRNSIIGKVHRLGLPGRSKKGARHRPRRMPSRPRQVRQVPQPSHPSPSTAVAVHNSGNGAGAADRNGQGEKEEPHIELVIPMEERKSILQLTKSTCKWPIGNPDDEEFHFCGRCPKEGSPYCEYHARIAYQPLTKRRAGKKKGRTPGHTPMQALVAP